MSNWSRIRAAAVLTLGLAGTNACGSDEDNGDCDLVTVVKNIKDTYYVGETGNISVSTQRRNPSASCVNVIAKTTVKFSTSASDIVSFTSASQLIAIAPGVATVSVFIDSAEPFSKSITVLAQNPGPH